MTPKKYKRLKKEEKIVKLKVTNDLLKAMVSYGLKDRLRICWNILARRY